MSVDMTDEMKDLFEMYSKGIEHFGSKERSILPGLVHYMKEFCEAYDNRVDLEQRLDRLAEKLDLCEEEEDE